MLYKGRFLELKFHTSCMFFYSTEYKYFEHNMKCLSWLNSSCVQRDELDSYTVIVQVCQTSGPHRLCGSLGEEKNLLSLPGIDLQLLACPACSHKFFIIIKKTQNIMFRVTHLPTLMEVACIFFA